MSIICCHNAGSISAIVDMVKIPRIGHNDVDRTERGSAFGVRFGELVDIPDVRQQRNALPTYPLDGISRLSEVIVPYVGVLHILERLANINGNDTSSLLRQRHRVRATLPTRRPRSRNPVRPSSVPTTVFLLFVSTRSNFSIDRFGNSRLP